MYCDRKEGMSTFNGKNGATAQEQSDGSILVTGPDGNTLTFSVSKSSVGTFNGPNGYTAKLVTDSDGNQTLVVQSQTGEIETFTLSSSSSPSSSSSSSSSSSASSNTGDEYNHYSQTSFPTILYGPNGTTARLIQTMNDRTIVITNKNGSTTIYTASPGQPSEAIEVSVFHGPNGGVARVVGQTIEVTMPNGNKLVFTGNATKFYAGGMDTTMNQYNAATNPSSTADYNTAFSTSTAAMSALPQGIPRLQIPPGDEDLYILKSEVVPPVCPKCPAPIVRENSDKDSSKCPPCPPCARCPEPAFDCVKRPNYGAMNPNYLPVPVLSDFSSFGM